MKKISVLIPCYNEQENIVPLSNEIVKIIENDLSAYDYEIIFIDNCSIDNTKLLLREICNNNDKIKAILNARNFGQFSSPYYGLCQTTGDCVILICADFQDPIELIPVFVGEWEKGYKIISGIKTKSKENKIMRFLRTCYYKTIRKMSNIEQIEHFTGFGLYDKSFIDILKNLHDPIPFLRGVVAELGYQRKDISYEQQKRRAGKT
jgi:glycosyltransferase involved in cell wall biosynthesis